MSVNLCLKLSAPQVIHLCLFHRYIPIELRFIIQCYFRTPLFDHDHGLYKAVNQWIESMTMDSHAGPLPREQVILRYGHISEWDTSLITNMSDLFYFEDEWDERIIMYRRFNDDLSQWDVSSVTNMSGLFRNVVNFNMPLETWGVSNVRNMDSMFYGATDFNQPLNSWNVGRVESMSNMFREASNFNQTLTKWDESSVTNECHVSICKCFQSIIKYLGCQ